MTHVRTSRVHEQQEENDDEGEAAVVKRGRETWKQEQLGHVRSTTDGEVVDGDGVDGIIAAAKEVEQNKDEEG